MLRAARRGHLFHVFIAVFILTSVFYLSTSSRSPVPHLASHTPASSSAAGNETLGFGAVIAVSKTGSPRVENLIQAANVTDLHIVIPEQPEWTEQDIENFRASDDPNTITAGSAMAWLGHHNALKWFLDSGLETALIIEDDVDWDIHLRTQQTPLAAGAIRSLVQNSTSGRRGSKQYPYGHPSDWDLLYIGHCGDYLNGLDEGIGVGYHQPASLSQIPHVVYPDDSVLPRYELHPFTASELTALNIPDGHRIAHVSAWPLCTFGYAVTRAAALKILTSVAPAREPLDVSGARAYDVSILNACRRNLGISIPPGDFAPVPNPFSMNSGLEPDFIPPPKPETRSLRCVSVSPELFHHVPGLSTIALETEAAGEDPRGMPPVDAAGFNQVMMRQETTNIGCGFWGAGFDFLAKMQGFMVQRTWMDVEVEGQPEMVFGANGIMDWTKPEPMMTKQLVVETSVPQTDTERLRVIDEGTRRLQYLRKEIGQKNRCLKSRAAAGLYSGFSGMA